MSEAASAPANPYSVGDAFNYGWNRFTKNWVPWVLGTVILGVILLVVQSIYQWIIGGPVTNLANGSIDPVTGQVTSGLGLFGAVVLPFLLYIPLFVVGAIVSANMVRAGLAETESKIELGKFFETERLGPVIIAAIIAGLLTAVGLLACFVGAIVVAFFVQFFAYFVLDADNEPWQSIKSSFSFVNQHLATIIVLFLASLLTTFIGALLCGIGLLVAYPVVIIAHAYTYKVLNGKPVDPVAA